MSTITPPRKAFPARTISPKVLPAATSIGRASAASSARSRSGSTTGTSCASARRPHPSLPRGRGMVREGVMAGATDTVTVAGEDGSVRLDRWFKRHYPALGHGRLEKLLRTGRIRVDGKRASSSDRVTPGQAIRLPPLEEMAGPGPAGPRQVSPGDEAMLRE